MYVEYSGWTQTHGSFYCNIYIDENRQDYALEYGDGTISKQATPFQYVTADWNNDGDIYEQFGAWFQSPHFNRNDFWTPEQMVCAAIDGQDPDRRFFDNQVRAVHGIEIPLPHQRPKLDTVLRDSELRCANRDADRNQKMHNQGIRPPNEPWAR